MSYYKDYPKYLGEADSLAMVEGNESIEVLKDFILYPSVHRLISFAEKEIQKAKLTTRHHVYLKITVMVQELNLEEQ